MIEKIIIAFYSRGYPTGLFMIGNWLSVSFKIRFKAAWSIVARGTVARPVAAQKILMFWQTMPASTAAISLVWSAMFPKRERSETSTKLTGADLTKS